MRRGEERRGKEREERRERREERREKREERNAEITYHGKATKRGAAYCRRQAALEGKKHVQDKDQVATNCR